MNKIHKLGLVGIALVAPLEAQPPGYHEIIPRLEKHIEALSFFDAKLVPDATNAETIQCGCAFLKDAVDFKHELVRLCAKKISAENKLVALSNTWSLFLEQFNDIERDLFLREFSQLLFAIYKNVLRCMVISNQTHPPKAPSLITIFTLYTRILSLPIMDLLNILDFCHAQFNEIIQEYGVPSRDNWRTWLKAYWWVPPIIIAALLTNVFIKYSFSYSEEPAFY